MTDIERKARECRQVYIAEVYRRMRDNDWPKVDKYGSSVDCTPAVHVPLEILDKYIATAIQSAVAETYEECVNIVEKIVAENWSPPGAAKYLAAALRARFPKLSP